MKVCEKCGVEQKDSNKVCVDCGALLGEPVSDAERERREMALSEEIYGMAEKAHDFVLTKYDIVVITLGAVGLAAALPMLFFWKKDTSVYLIYAIVGFVIAVIFGAFPKLEWAISSLGARRYYEADGLSPSFAWHMMRKITNGICAFGGAALVIAHIMG